MDAPQARPRRGEPQGRGEHIEFNRAFKRDYGEAANRPSLACGPRLDPIGDFPAHNGLWEMAVKTAHDALTRMALVPRVLEARGLDVSPVLVKKLQSAGDTRAVEILQIILRDEIGHVRIGNRWYGWLCGQRGLEPVTTFRRLLEEYGTLRLRPPFYETARREAGFSERELALLGELAAAGK